MRKKTKATKNYLSLALCYLVAGPFALFVPFVAIVIQTPPDLKPKRFALVLDMSQG